MSEGSKRGRQRVLVTEVVEAGGKEAINVEAYAHLVAQILTRSDGCLQQSPKAA